MSCPRLLVTVLALVASTLSCAQPAAPDPSASDELVLWTSREVDAARASNDPARIARILRAVLRDRIRGRAARLDATERLLGGVTASDLEAVRASYVQQHGEDPEITIRSDGLFQHVVRLPREQEAELLELMTRPTMDADAAALYEMFARPEPLTLEDRAHYFAMLPRMGLWDAPTRAAANDPGLDAFEREQLRSALGRVAGDADLDDVLQAVEHRLPTPARGDHERARSIAVVVSSHGAQWQESSWGGPRAWWRSATTCRSSRRTGAPRRSSATV